MVTRRPALVAEFSDAVAAELRPIGGGQVKTIGDAVMLRIPDPGAAIHLGRKIVNDVMRDHGAPAVRVGLHHGPAVKRNGDWFGATVNLAADRTLVALLSRTRDAATARE
jgi:adenylate cyclase